MTNKILIPKIIRERYPDIDINLIDTVNPFQRAFEELSKSVTPQV